MEPLMLKELGNEYLQEASRLYARIHTMRFGASDLTEARLKELYDMARDCRLTGERLLHYYD